MAASYSRARPLNSMPTKASARNGWKSSRSALSGAHRDRPFPLFRRLLPSSERRQAKRRLHGLVIVDHRRLITAIHQVGLRSRRQTNLDATSGRKILACHYIEDQLHVLVPVGALVL